MIDIKVSGAQDFVRLSKALKQAGQTDLRKGLHKALKQTVDQHKETVAEALASALPSGLSARGAAVKQATQVKTGKNPGVTVGIRYGKAGRGLGAANAKLVNASGSIRHPVFSRSRWVAQSVGGSGWFDEGWRKAAPELRQELVAVLEDIANQVVRKVR